MSDTPSLYSFEIVEKNTLSGNNRLGVVATVSAIVGATITLTTTIIGAAKSKRMIEAMKRAEANINAVKDYAINVIRAYNSEAFRVLNDSSLNALAGVTTETIEGRKITGIINDGFAEYQYYFPEGITGAVRELNLFGEEERLAPTMTIEEFLGEGNDGRGYSSYLKHKNSGYTFSLNNRARVLDERLKQYGLKLKKSKEKNYYIIGINENDSEWNDQNLDNWFSVDVNGKWNTRGEVGANAKQRRDDGYRKAMRARVHSDFVARVDWLRESGLPSFIWRGYLTGEDSRKIGVAEAAKDFSHVSAEIERINEERKKVAISEGVTVPKTEAPQKAAATITEMTSATKLNLKKYNPVEWFQGLTTKNKIVTSAFAVASGLFILKD